MAAGNRLTAAELAALEPGDTVTVQPAHEFARSRFAVGTVVRVAGPYIVVTCKSPRGSRVLGPNPQNSPDSYPTYARSPTAVRPLRTALSDRDARR